MDALIEDLSAVQTDFFVLISTLSVYAVTSLEESLALRPEKQPASHAAHTLTESREVRAWAKQSREEGQQRPCGRIASLPI